MLIKPATFQSLLLLLLILRLLFYHYCFSYCVVMRAGPVVGCVAPWLAFLRSLGAEQQPQQTPIFRACI